MGNKRYSRVMAITITISDSLAVELDRRRREAGLESLDAAAEALLAGAIFADASDADRLGYSDGALRVLIAEGEASGPSVAWDADAVREEVRARFTARRPD